MGITDEKIVFIQIQNTIVRLKALVSVKCLTLLSMMVGPRRIHVVLHRYIPYCHLFSRELNFAKISRAYFAEIKFRDLAKYNVKRNFSNFSRKFSNY